MQAEERDKLRKQVVTLIRSLLISSKGGVNLDKINRDYREIIGKPIPYRDLGYVTLDEFLDQSPDLCRVSYSPSGIIVHGVATAADAHVASLVARQSSKNKKTRPLMKPPARRPHSQWQPPTPSQPFRGQPYQRFQPGSRLASSSNQSGSSTNRPGGSGRFPVIQHRSQHMMAQYQQRLRTPNYQQSPNNINGGNNGNGGMPIMRQRNAPPQKTSQQNHQRQNYQQQQQQTKINTTPPKNQGNSIKILEQYFSQNNLGDMNFKTAAVEMKTGGGGGNQKNNKGKKMTKYVSTVKVGEQSFQTFPNSYNSKEAAEEAAAAVAISKLDLNSGQNSSGNINNTESGSVMSMPIGHFEDMTTNNENQDAIESLVDIIFDLVGKRTNGVWSTQIDVEYRRKYQKSLPDKWPDKIETSEEASKKLRVDKPIEGRFIIYPIIPSEVIVTPMPPQPLTPKVNKLEKPKQPPPLPSRPPSSSLPQKRPSKLVLPEDQNWDVYITCVHSTVNVCLRLLGEPYSTKFDDMVTNMELKYFESDQVPLNKDVMVTNAEVGKLYAATVESDWHRVEVTNVHGLEVTCYFIDHGDEDLLKVKDLRQLLPEFLELAPQAKSVRLAGLEDLAGDQSAQAELTNAALGRSLVGQVHAKDESGISLILYDTSNSDEDVNINEKILEKFKPLPTPSGNVSNGVGQLSKSGSENRISSGSPPPPIESQSESSSSSTTSTNAMEELLSLDLTTLKPLMPPNVPEVGEFLDINITLAASPSNFTVQPWQNTTQLEKFQAELNAFYNIGKNAYSRTLSNADINAGDKFYAGQHMDGKWYRVKVNATIDETTVAAKITDYGDFTMIPLERLQPLWPQFRDLPMQAIDASLADIVASKGDWSAEDTIWFSNRVVDKQFVSRIRDVTYDPLEDNVRISVSLVDTTHPTTDIYIEKQLVEEKRAVYLCV